MYGSAIIHEVQFSTNNQWHVGQEIRHFFSRNFPNSVLEASVEICGVPKIITTNNCPHIDGESLVDFHLPTENTLSQ
jgi:hypothetical protein